VAFEKVEIEIINPLQSATFLIEKEGKGLLLWIQLPDTGFTGYNNHHQPYYYYYLLLK
jgi:hypothetical protein